MHYEMSILMICLAIIYTLKTFDCKSIQIDSINQTDKMKMKTKKINSDNFLKSSFVPNSFRINNLKLDQTTAFRSKRPKMNRLFHKLLEFFTGSKNDENEANKFCFVDRRNDDSFDRVDRPSHNRRDPDQYKRRTEIQRCNLDSNISNLFRPTMTYNVSLIIFYDIFFEKRFIDAQTAIKYLVQGLQDAFNSYDLRNEIGFVEFYVIDVIRLNLPIGDSIYLRDYYEIFKTFITRNRIPFSRGMIPVWLTNSRVMDDETVDLDNYNRLEGVAKTGSCLANNLLTLINCNSLAKSIITFAHEMGHLFDADHDNQERYKFCDTDKMAYLMSQNYSPKRNVFSCLSRSVIYDFFNQNPECFTKPSNYKYDYYQIQTLRPLTLDEQCADSFSKKFKSNQPSMNSSNFCERLHCKNGFIELSIYPVMNYTPCNRNPEMVCCFSQCVINCRLAF